MAKEEPSAARGKDGEVVAVDEELGEAVAEAEDMAAAAGSTRSLHRASTRSRTRRRHAGRCGWPKRILGRRTPRWMIAPNFFGRNAVRKSWRTRLNSNACEMIMRAGKLSWRSGRPHFSIYCSLFAFYS